MSRAVLVVASSCCLMGCLITRDPSFEPPANLPPSVHGSAENPMHLVLVEQVGVGTPTGPDAGPTSSEVNITAVVRDVNVRDDLEGRIFLNLDRDDPIPSLIADRVRITPDIDEDPYSRRVEMMIPRSRLRAGCNWVELHVSSEFQGLPSLAPVTSGDVGTGVWFIAGVDEANETPDMRTCETPE